MTQRAGRRPWRTRLAAFARRRKESLQTRGAGAQLLIPVTEAVESWSAEGFGIMARRVRRRLFGAQRFTAVVLAHVQAVSAGRVSPTCPPMTASDGVSIVIPVLNNARLTMQCLRSIVEHTPAGQFEVIVVDNGSNPETRNALAGVPGLRVIRNERNLGFVEACNQGSRAARGTDVVFLNNDTVVLPGWLEALRRAIQTDPRNGAVGAMLVYPDGRLQEAGGVIWSDGSGWNYGRNQDPDAPEYNFVREVDYCSGACLMVRRDVFASLGGFDEHYAPAYYEDVDLCFRLREHGYRVLFEPRARVVHFEGATAGTNVSSGLKQYQIVNQRKFVERHRTALSRQLPMSPHMVKVAADRRRGRRVVVIDHLVPRHEEDAGSLRMTALLQILVDLEFVVTFIPDNLDRVEPYTSELQQRGIEVLYGAEPIIPYLQQAMDQTDVAILCRAPFAHKYLQTLQSPAERPFIIFDTVDLHYLREERQAALSGDPTLALQAQQTRNIELAVANGSDLVWVTSDYEVEVLREAGVSSPVEVVPLVHCARARPRGAIGRRDLLFVGGFLHAPNGDAVKYFVREIFPLIRLQLPGVRFLVAGSNMPQEIRDLESQDVVPLGFVKDIDRLFEEVRLSVAPLRYGAGVKGKISHSLAHGVPVVTTPIGAEGMPLLDGEHLLVGRTPEEFAAHVVRLYRDDGLWELLSQNGRDRIEATFGHTAVRTRVRRLLADVGRRPGLGAPEASALDVAYAGGFFEEEGEGEHAWRWMGPEGRVCLRNTSRAMVLSVAAVLPPATAVRATVRLFLDHELLDTITGEESIERSYEVSCDGRRARILQLRIQVDTPFVPAEIDPRSLDHRKLGLILRPIGWRAATPFRGS